MTDALLRAVLEALPHAVSVMDGDGRLAFANPAFWRSADLPESACPPGTPLREVVRLLAYRGLYGPGDPEALAEAAMTLDRARPLRRQIGTADGSRAFETHSLPLPGGGFAAIAHEITPYLRARDEQAARARLLEGTLARLGSGIARFDAAMRMDVFNPAYEALHGLPGGTLRAGMTHRDILALLEERGEFAGGDEAAGVAARMERDRGRAASRTRLRASGQVLRFDSQPTPDGGFTIEVADITALKRAEDEATRRAALIAGVVQALPHGVCVYGPDQRVAMINDAYGRIMQGAELAVGERLEEVTARRIAQGEYDADYAKVARIRRIGPAATGDEVVRRRPNGTVIAVRAAPLPDGGHISVVTDVTALHQAEAEARARAEMLDAVLDALPDGVCVYGPDHRARATNAAYRRLLGDAAVRLGESLEEVAERRIAMGEQSREMAARLYARHLGPPEEAGRPIRRLRPNGTAIITRAGRLPDGGHIAVLSDVTALHRAEQELERRASILEASFAAIRHGIAVYGPDRRLLARNERLAELSGLALADCAPGTLFDDLVERQVALGILSPGQADFARRLDRSRPYRDSRLRPDGRIVEILNDPAPDGGFVITFTDVTALRRAEEELRHRAAILEASFTTMRHGIAVWGPDRSLLALNDRTLEMLGLPHELVRPGVLFDTLIDAQAAAGVLTPDAAARAKAHDRSRPYRSSRTHPDGRILEIFSDPTPEGGFVVTFTDVTALQQAQADARRRAALLETSFAAIRHGIAIYGPDRRLRAWNDRVGDLAGLPLASHVVGRSLDELVAEQVARGVLDAAEARAVLKLDRSRSDRTRRARPDGRIVEVMSDPTPDGGFVVTFADVTALHRAEQELRQRAVMQGAMLSNIRHGIILYGPDRRLLATSARTAGLVAMPPERLTAGRTMDEMLDEQVARGEMTVETSAALKALDRGRPQHYTRRRADGRILETVSEPTPDGGFVITYTDVTEDRRIRAELERARAEAEAASEAKSRFLATMSHELRSPLNAVIGLSEAIAIDDDARRRGEYAAMINEAGRHLLQLVDDILDVARSQTGTLEAAEAPVELESVLAAAAQAARPAAVAAGLVLETTLPPALPRLSGDAARLRQVLDKLLSNAVKFTPAGGRIAVSAVAGPEGLAIRIADTGIGIPRAERERMFEPFTQLDSSHARRFQGSGLGLHLARTLAGSMGATLTLEDPAGERMGAPGLVAVLRFPPARLIPISTASPSPA